MLLGLLLSVASPMVHAGTNNLIGNIVEAHHLEPTEQYVYTITGEDPYLIFRLEGMTRRSLAGFYMKIDPEINKGCHYQLFWQTPEMGFSEHRSFRFHNDGKTLNASFYIPFDESAEMNAINAIRIDFEQCVSNKIGIEEVSLRSEADAPVTEHAILPSGLISPVLPMAIKPHIHEKGPWSFHDMTRLNGNHYRITQGDPYIISPALNVPLSKVKGVFFKLKFPNIDEKIKLQLFWSTYARGYSVKDNYIFWDTAE